MRLPMRSDAIKRGFDRAPHRSLLRATGQIRAKEDFDKPFVAVCNSYVDIVPGHVHLREFAALVKDAVPAQVVVVGVGRCGGEAEDACLDAHHGAAPVGEWSSARACRFSR